MFPYQLFSSSVDRYPEEIALEVGDQVLTYRELDTRAAKIAARMCAALGRAPHRVGIRTARDPFSYAAYLATMRLGATAVPLSRNAPARRDAQMRAAARVDVLVLADGNVVPTGVDTGPGPAYILFTSGSTGAPKGVPISRANLAAYLSQQLGTRSAGPGCRFSQTFDLTFDPSVHDILTAWATGSALVVPETHELLSPVSYVSRRRITHWFSVPSIVSLAHRLGTLRTGSMPTLRWSLFIGEQLTMKQVAAWHAAAPNSVLENHYGPTELTVSCASHRLPAGPIDPTAPGTVPIGSVYPGLEAIVLDGNGRPADEGELCVRGAQRFAGYLDPAMNAGRFLNLGDRVEVYDNSTPLDDRHWYRTGDRVRRDGPGTLVHLGRTDDQLKLRGHRIEPGEIETALRSHPHVRDVAVTPVPAEDGELELVAVYTGLPVGERDLLAAIQQTLPAYMLPTAFVHLTEFPLGPNGKTDRARLAELVRQRNC